HSKVRRLWKVRSSRRSWEIEIADEVDEHGRGVSETVDAVENAAVARDQPAGVLDAEIALHRRHGDVAEKARDAENEPRERGPVPIHRREIGPDEPRHDRRHGDTADQSLPCLLRAD